MARRPFPGAVVIAGVVQLVFGLLSSTVFILVLFIGFCVFLGLTKLKRTTGGGPCRPDRAARAVRAGCARDLAAGAAYATLSGCHRNPRLTIRCSSDS